MALDNAKNFAKATVSTGYTSASTSVVLTTGHGAKMPTVPFNVVWWNSTDYADPSDDPSVEIVRVTAISTDTLTITRAQEGTTASNKNTAAKTYKMIAGLTAKVVNTDIPAPSVVTIIPQTVGPISSTVADTVQINSNTTAYLGQIVIPFQITVNKLSIRVGTVTVAGTVDVTIYTENGQTQVIAVTSATLVADSINTISVASVVLPAGIYYVMTNTNGTADVRPTFWFNYASNPFGSSTSLLYDVTSEPKIQGTLTITAGTPPATFNPTSLTAGNNCALAIRLDN